MVESSHQRRAGNVMLALIFAGFIDKMLTGDDR